ncbi:MAG: T9SS type A sorting domain-containing protein, partial [Marinoscillum sp.]
SNMYFQPGEYQISLTVSNGICTDTQTKVLTVVEGRSVKPGDGIVNFIEFYRINIFPNPAQDILNLDFELSDEVPLDIQIFDFSGTQVVHHGIEEISGEISMDISGLASGMYIMVLKASRSMKKIRFVKMK